MKIAVLSGKGGAGKTLISVNMAAALENALYLDCDVEEPNGHLFFKPKNPMTYEVKVGIPHVDPLKCNGCRKCVSFCQFNALAYIGGKVMVFDDICHSCGGCTYLCPQGAIREEPKAIGSIREAYSDRVQVVSGILNPGEASGVPIIKALLGRIEELNPQSSEDGMVIIDCPPGSACTLMESIKEADYCLIVAEPTRFGAHNLEMIHRLLDQGDIPYGVLLNKVQEGYNPSEDYCLTHDIPILSVIEFDSNIGMLNADGHIVARENRDFKDLMLNLINKIKEAVYRETSTDS